MQRFCLSLIYLLIPLWATADSLTSGQLEPKKPKSPPGEYLLPENKSISFQLPEQVGYAGLIIANGGLKGSPSSFLATHYNITLDMRIGEEENYEVFHSGAQAGLFTSADSLAAYGGQLNVVAVATPLFYRFDDFLIVRREIKSFDHLKGKTLAVPKFTVADFFLRNSLRSLNIDTDIIKDLTQSPSATSVGIFFTEQVDQATALFKQDIWSGENRLAGCAGWDPLNQDVIQNTEGVVQYLGIPREINECVADILVLNRPFSQKNPRIVTGLIHGLLYGNEIVNQIKQNVQTQELSPPQFAVLQLIADSLTDGKPDRYSISEILELMNDCDYANFSTNFAFLTNRLVGGLSFQEHYQKSAFVFGFSEHNSMEYSKMMCVDYLNALSTEFSIKRFEISSISAFVRSGIRWSPRSIKFEPSNVNQLDFDDNFVHTTLRQTVDYLRWNETSIASLNGYVGNPKNEDVKLEHIITNAKNISKQRSSTVKEKLIALGANPNQIIVEGIGFSEHSYGHVEIHMIDLEAKKP